MYIISREEVDDSYSLDQIKKVRKDERNEAGFSFFCGGAVTLYLECENDRCAAGLNTGSSVNYVARNICNSDYPRSTKVLRTFTRRS